MKLAVVNATNGGLSGGAIKYLRHLVPRLQTDPRISHLDVFVPAGYESELHDVSNIHSIHPRDAFRRFTGVSAELRALAPDVIFVPNARSLPIADVPQVTMIRNMEPLVQPIGRNSLVEGAKNILRARVARHAARKSSRVIAVSEFVRATVIDEWHIAPDRVDVVYHGVDSPTPTQSFELPPDLRALERGKFIVSVGSIRPYRGLEDAIRALAHLPDAMADWKLVILGAPDAGSVFYERELHQLASHLGVAHRIVWAGHASPAVVTWSLNNCGTFVLTSRVEACPNAGLEALSVGCSCVVTTNAPMPEFFGDVARYYEPGDSSTLARQLTDLAAESPATRQSTADKAIERSRAYVFVANDADFVVAPDGAVGRYVRVGKRGDELL